MKKVLITLGSGGHSAEMCRWILQKEIKEATFVLNSDDFHSKPPIRASKVVRIPRVRKVGQWWFFGLLNFFFSFWSLVVQLQGDEFQLVLTNGPSISIPVVLYFWIRKKFCVENVQTRIVFAESVTRVRKLSLSARILHAFVDVVVVWWPELQHTGCNKCRLVNLLR